MNARTSLEMRSVNRRTTNILAAYVHLRAEKHFSLTVTTLS